MGELCFFILKREIISILLASGQLRMLSLAEALSGWGLEVRLCLCEPMRVQYRVVCGRGRMVPREKLNPQTKPALICVQLAGWGWVRVGSLALWG